MSSAMKDSGIPWIGEIPSHWEELRIKYAGGFEKGRLPKETNNERIGLPIIGASEMLGREPRQYTEETSLPQCTKTDILILWDGANAGIVANRLQGVVSSTACKYSCTDSKVHKQYLFFLLKYAENYFRSKVYGTTIPHMSFDYIDSFPLLLPPMVEQQAIADFLDKKCGEIDEMVSLQEKIVEELKAYKQSVITEAVCKGLNPDVPMRDSGIEWIGQIPEGWEILKTLWALDMPITDGPHTTPELFDTGIPFVSAEAVSCGNGGIDFSHIRGFISQEFYEECCLKYVPQRGDVYMIKSGATTGRVSIVDTDIVFTIWSPLAVFRANPKRILPRFLFYSIQGEYYQEQVRLGWTYGTQQNIGMRTLETLQIVLPSLSEQQTIVDYLDKKCKGIGSLISLKQSKIDALKEYKKSIIYEYITGKKEVI